MSTVRPIRSPWDGTQVDRINACRLKAPTDPFEVEAPANPLKLSVAYRLKKNTASSDRPLILAKMRDPDFHPWSMKAGPIAEFHPRWN